MSIMFRVSEAVSEQPPMSACSACMYVSMSARAEVTCLYVFACMHVCMYVCIGRTTDTWID